VDITQITNNVKLVQSIKLSSRHNVNVTLKKYGFQVSSLLGTVALTAVTKQ